MVTQKKPLRVCIVGPLLGRHQGWVVSQGEIVADLFAQHGYSVKQTSPVIGRVGRLVDVVRSLYRWRHEIDVVLLMVFSGPAFGIVDCASWVAKRINKPLVMWLHGGNLPPFIAQYPNWSRRVLQRGDVLISPSGYLAEAMGAVDASAQVIPNVLTLPDYPFQLRNEVAPRLLWMRTFHEIYNPLMALDVVEALLSDYPDIHLTMAGQEKGMLALTKAEVAKRGLETNVTFVGFLDMAGKQAAFAAHDIFLNTNHVDNMPVSVIEAAAFGLPVVATQVGGIPFLLENEVTGLLVEDGNSAEMATAIRQLLANPELARTLSINGRFLAEKSDWPVIQTQWETIFDALGLI